MEKEFLENLQVGEAPLPQEVVEAIWEAHQQKVKDVEFAGVLHGAITRAGGKNHKAIMALLDLPALKESQDMTQAAEDALKSLKGECGYLFETVAPALARFTGTQTQIPEAPMTLAGALRERFRK